MALSFLYVAFTRILQLVRLSRRDRDELAIEVVMLRHEVAVFPCLATQDFDMSSDDATDRRDRPSTTTASTA